MARRNNTTLLLIIVGIVVLFGVYYSFNKTNKSNNENEPYKKAKDVSTEKSGEPKSDIEIIQDDDTDSDYQMLDDDLDEKSFAIGFGMGPGLYGSGRHTSEMVGN